MMCRIYGFMGAVSHADRMPASRDVQLTGGPDEQQYVTGHGWALGSNRLSIQDPARGQQPFASRGGSVVLAFNGEIYNFRQLRDVLRASGVEIEGDSDGAVLLPLYVARGDSFVEQLEGMFAIAIVDVRRNPVVKLWSDPLGIKSLYYTASSSGIAFASEIPGLQALVEPPFELDRLSIDNYFDMQCLPNGASLYEGVRQLHPGEFVSFTDDRVASARAKRTAPTESPSDDRDETPPVRLLHQLGEEIARMSLQSAPIAVQASGGLDSSLMLTLLRRERTDVTAFHIAYRGDFHSDERLFALEAAKYAGVPCELIEVDPDDLPATIPEMVAALGSPNAAPHSLSAYVLFREIAAHGFRVCFVGDGADEQFGGYRRYVRALNAGEDSGWMTTYLDRLAVVPQARYRQLFTHEYRTWLRSVAGNRIRNLAALASPSPSRVEQLLMFDRLHKLPCFNLRKLDHLSMAHSVEARVPYCQPAVTQLAEALPPVWKIDGSQRKRVLFHAARGLIPESVRSRPKQPFTLPVDTLLIEGTPLWSFVVDVMSSPKLCELGFLERSAVEGVISEHRSGANHSRLLWAIMVLELSMQRHASKG